MNEDNKVDIQSTIRKTAYDYFMLTVATIILIIGVYFFKFPNNFCFGGVTGISIILQGVFGLSASSYNLYINIALLIVGFVFLGKNFGFMTTYVTLLSSLGISFLDYLDPMRAPLTDQPMLELIFAIVLPAFASAILFNMGASSGGTDIIALIVKKYSSADIGMAIFWVDLAITIVACFVFDIKTGLFSFAGLMAKTLVIDGVIESVNLCKYFTIVSVNPEPILKYIQVTLRRSATLYHAEGAYARKNKTVILTVVKRSQAVSLRAYIKKNDPEAFIMITNSSEIIGNGFQR